MNNFPKVFVIVLNYNGASTLDTCLKSVFQSDYSNLELVVVDNDSHDGSFETARKNFSRAHFIKNSSNLGFSRGNNVGIRFALEKFADYVFLLNNDAIVEKTTISALVKAADDNKEINLASPLIFDGRGKNIWFAGGTILWNKMKAVHISSAASNLPYKTGYISGCAMLISKDVFKKIGLFDERFFLYYEDADFSLRADKDGFSPYVIPQATVRHLEKSSEENAAKTYWLVFSGLLFFRLHASLMRKIWQTVYLALRKVKNLAAIFSSDGSDKKEVRRAYRDFGNFSG